IVPLARFEVQHPGRRREPDHRRRRAQRGTRITTRRGTLLSAPPRRRATPHGPLGRDGVTTAAARPGPKCPPDAEAKGRKAARAEYRARPADWCARRALAVEDTPRATAEFATDVDAERGAGHRLDRRC